MVLSYPEMKQAFHDIGIRYENEKKLKKMFPKSKICEEDFVGGFLRILAFMNDFKLKQLRK